jgi:hypothetical protein
MIPQMTPTEPKSKTKEEPKDSKNEDLEYLNNHNDGC